MATYTQTDLETITQAIIALGSGKRRVRCIVAGVQVEYAQASLPALRSLRAEIAQEITTASTGNCCFVATSKGF